MTGDNGDPHHWAWLCPACGARVPMPLTATAQGGLTQVADTAMADAHIAMHGVCTCTWRPSPGGAGAYLARIDPACSAHAG